LSFAERVREQADYFKITPAQAVRVGKKAAEFTERRLGAHPFTVLTRWEGAEGRSRLPRHYAFVLADDKDLAEELVKEGLARLFGVKADRPGGSSIATELSRLRRLEREAKSARRGAWARSTDAAHEEPRGLPVMPLPPSVAPASTNAPAHAPTESY